MKQLILLSVILSIFTANCQYQRTILQDADTTWKSTKIIPPFGQEDASNSQMSYTILDDGTCEITTGQKAEGTDNTGQIEPAMMMMSLMMEYMKMQATGGIPLPNP